jgi:glycosyltransferase involved in cell wall biosynthesis
MHAAALGITEIVAHLGERDDHLSVVRAADLAWVIADQDNAAFGFLDAMALRVPVLAERGPLARRYIADGITGVLIGAADPPTTAARIANLLAHDDRRAAMGNAGRTRVAREFTDAAMVDGFEHATKVARDRSRWHS